MSGGRGRGRGGQRDLNNLNGDRRPGQWPRDARPNGEHQSHNWRQPNEGNCSRGASENHNSNQTLYKNKTEQLGEGVRQPGDWTDDTEQKDEEEKLTKGIKNVNLCADAGDDWEPEPSPPGQTNSTEDGDLRNFFSLGKQNLPYVPPMNRKSCGRGLMTHVNSPIESSLASDLPPTIATLGVNPEKVYVDEYMKKLEIRIDEISEMPMPVRIPLPLHQPADIGQSRPSSISGVDTSLIGTVVRNIPKADQPDDVWLKFNMDYFRYREKTQALAVSTFRDMIMNSISAHQVVIVEGFTGCGKTTQIPQYILDLAARDGRGCNVVVTQPRRIAAISVTQRVCEERGWNMGSLVGYQIGMSRLSSPETRLTYMTTGILLQTLISRKRLDDYTHIIVDEVHGRDLETDLLLLVIKKLMVDEADRVTKIILMSATLNAVKFANYFPQWKTTAGSVICRIPPNTIYPTTVYYLDTMKIPDVNMKNDEGFSEIFEEAKIRPDYYDYAVRIIANLDAVDKEMRETSELPFKGRGGVLVFLPGMMEIDYLYRTLFDYSNEKCGGDLEKDELKWLLLPLHSLITAEDQKRVFKEASSGYRKVILATNIAESSITVSDVAYVIDFCLTKSLSCDTATNYSCLRLEWASKNQCTQRKGRVGRVSTGIVYRMVPSKFYNEGLREEALPDMEKACLENVVLDVKNLNLGSPKAILALSIDPPMLTGIERAVSNLKEAGALSIRVGSHYTKLDGDMTQMGKIMAKLPFDIRLSRLIVLGHIFGVLEETVIIAAGLSVKSPFSYPFQRRLVAYMSRCSWSSQTFSDCLALLNVYRTWRERLDANRYYNRNEEWKWARAYFLQLNVLRDIHELIQDLGRRLKNVGIDLRRTKLVSDTLDAEQGLILKMVIAGAFYPNYFVRHRPNQKEYEKSILRELSGYNPMLSMVFKGFPDTHPGALYAESIARYFTHNDCFPYVHFLDPRVVVSSDSRSSKQGLISMNIYRGIKMRQIREPLIIQALNWFESYKAMTEAIAAEKAAQSLRLVAPPQTCLPTIREDTIEVIITEFIDLDNFWGVKADQHHYVDEIRTSLQQQAKNLQLLPEREFVVGVLCVAEDQDEFYRARIDFKVGCDVYVFCVDNGKSFWRRRSELLAFNQALKDIKLHTLELLAIQFRIHGIKPLARYCSVWGVETNKKSKDFIASTDYKVTAKIYSIVESVVACDLLGKEDLPSLRELLLEDRNVAVLEESRDSLDNNSARHLVKVCREYREDIFKCQNEKQLCSYNLRATLPSPTDGKCEIQLRGPFSPLEMTFASVCRSAHMKAVQVEGNSVNSVALDQEPKSHTARLLVAAGVGVNQRSGGIIARNTTLMPAVPGLVAILTMIFCPKMELRYDEQLGRYTGCLSGLGIDPVSGEPVYADHDMELVFDTRFDNEDLKAINNIRRSMNLVLENETTNFESDYDINNIRVTIRKALQDLLERDRESLEEEYQPATHIWGLLQDKKGEDDEVDEVDDTSSVNSNDSLSGRKSKNSTNHKAPPVFPLHREQFPTPEEMHPLQTGANSHNPLDWDDSLA